MSIYPINDPILTTKNKNNCPNTTQLQPHTPLENKKHLNQAMAQASQHNLQQTLDFARRGQPATNIAPQHSNTIRMTMSLDHTLWPSGSFQPYNTLDENVQVLC